MEQGQHATIRQAVLLAQRMKGSTTFSHTATNSCKQLQPTQLRSGWSMLQIPSAWKTYLSQMLPSARGLGMLLGKTSIWLSLYNRTNFARSPFKTRWAMTSHTDEEIWTMRQLPIMCRVDRVQTFLIVLCMKCPTTRLSTDHNSWVKEWMGPGTWYWPQTKQSY